MNILYIKVILLRQNDSSTNGCPKIGAKYPISSHTIGAKYHKPPSE